MRYAHIENGKVVNVVELAEGQDGFVQSDTANIGDDYIGGEFSALAVPAPTARDVAIGKILALEASVTERRLREAVLGIDGGWLKALNDQIVALRVSME